MKPIALAAGLALAALSGAAAFAQIERLPSTSRSEAQSGALNSGLVVQERNRAVQQQNQFETNSLRNDLSRPVPPPVLPPPIVIQR